MKMEGGPVREALRFRHSKDVLIEECNLGSAQAGCRRMDAWVLLKTWSPWTTIGYEIKTDRSDFLRDRKWVEYLPFCHEMNFVCPAKLIQPEELPAEVGLLWLNGGQRLTTKRKAVRREPDQHKLALLMSYALMSRARIVGDMWEANGAHSSENAVATWRAWLAEKAEKRKLGHNVSRAVREAVNASETRARQAIRERETLETVQRRLEEMGLGDVRSAWELERRLGATGQPLRQIQRLAESILELTKPALPSRTAVDADRNDSVTAETQLARKSEEQHP